MKLFALLLVCTAGAAYSASLNGNAQCHVCTTALDWARSNENLVDLMKLDAQVSDEFVEALASDATSMSICGQLGMCVTDLESDENEGPSYMTNLKKGGGGKKRHGRPHIHIDPHFHHHDCNNNNC